jgi:hypothetical protein
MMSFALPVNGSAGASGSQRAGIPGRTDVTSRALENAVGAIAADELGVARRDVRVSLSDESGSLAVALVSPASLPSLVVRSAPRSTGLLSSAQSARVRIQDRVLATTGRTVSRVSIRFDRALIPERRRVS